MTPLLYLFLLIFVALLSFGIYLTVVAYKKDNANASKKLTDHIKTLKWLGPLVISIGVIGIALMSVSVWKTMDDKGSSPAHSASAFGFRFF